MKKVLFSLIFLVTLIGLSASGCNFVYGSGAIVSKEYDYQNFTNVEVSSYFFVEVTRSSIYQVVVSTHGNIIDQLDVVQSGNTLKLRLKSGSYANTDLKATIGMPEINRFAMSGASKGNIKGFKSTNGFDLDVSGASQLELDMEAGKTTIEIFGASRVSGKLVAQDAEFEVSGASRCELDGSAGDTHLEVSGASRAALASFPARNADVNVSGASQVSINTAGKLDVNVSGSSTLEYSGNPRLGKVSVTGASRLNER